MAGILDHAQPVALRQGVDLARTARDAGEMQRDDRFGPRADQRLGRSDVDAEVVVVDVAHHRARAAGANRLMIGDVVEGRRDHLIARPHARQSQRNMQG